MIKIEDIICIKRPNKILWDLDVIGIKVLLVSWIIANLILFFLFFALSNVSRFLWTFFVESLLIWTLFILVRIFQKIHRLKRTICYDIKNKKIIIKNMDKDTLLELNLSNIERIITSPYENGYTFIETDAPLSKHYGTHFSLEYSGGEFGLMLCDEFKKYWESKGDRVRIESKKIPIFGERVICIKD